MVIILSFTFAINSFLQFIFIISRTTSLKNRTFGTFSLRKYLLNRHFVFMTETAHETKNIKIKRFLRRTLQNLLEHPLKAPQKFELVCKLEPSEQQVFFCDWVTLEFTSWIPTSTTICANVIPFISMTTESFCVFFRVNMTLKMKRYTIHNTPL